MLDHVSLPVTDLERSKRFVVDGFKPDRRGLFGAAICVVGVVVMVAPPRA